MPGIENCLSIWCWQQGLLAAYWHCTVYNLSGNNDNNNNNNDDNNKYFIQLNTYLNINYLATT